MKSRINRGMLASIVVFLVLLIDQIIKIAVKTNMRIGDDIVITDWFLIRFIENNGMAWGIDYLLYRETCESKG